MADNKTVHTDGGTYIEGSVHTQGGDFVAGDKQVIITQTPEAQRERRNLLILLDKVVQFWVEGVLENSLFNQVLIDLTEQPRPELITHPWETVVELPDQPPQPLAGQSLLEIFTQAGNSLLVLGDPGSGKTTSLLELARDLAVQARADLAQPIPVVLNLSTWGQKKTRLAEWAAEELNSKYGIPRELGRRWLDHNDLVLLLDGLDEVPERLRRGCIESLNAFRVDHGLLGMAVCSRTEEYRAAGLRVALSGAVVIQPLTGEQVDAYLSTGDPGLAALRETLRHDPALAELAQSPLLLSVIALTYRGLPAGSLADPSPEARRRQLFDTYIQCMSERRGADLKGRVDDLLPRLRAVAQGMTQRSQSIFLLEDLQPTWLLRWWSCAAYYLLTRALIGLLLGLVFGVSLGLAINDPQLLSVVIGSARLFAGAGLVTGLVKWAQVEWTTWRRRDPEYRAGRLTSLFNLEALILGGMAAYPVLASAPEPFGVFYFAISLVFYVAVASLLLWNRAPSEEIRPVEGMQWSWQSARAGLLWGLGFTLLLTLLAFRTIDPGNPLGSFVTGLAFFAVPVVGLFVLFMGLRARRVDQGARPNQGIVRSGRSALVSFLLVAVSAGALIALVGAEIFATQAGLDGAVLLRGIAAAGLFFGAVSALRNGGITTLQHYSLRLLLALENHLPLRLIPLLDDACQLVLLRRVGSGYIFVHRMFLEYFASPARR